MARCFLSIYCPHVPASRVTTLVEWCDRYSPLVAQDGSDGLILDITGVAHLFGGEGPLLLDLQGRLQRMGIEARGAIADTWGIAWALAHYSQCSIVHSEAAVAALNPLPTEALRLPEEIVMQLRRLGLSRIGALHKISRQALAARFGAALITRLDQVFRAAEEPLTPWRPPAPYRAARILAAPIFGTQDVTYLLREELLEEICARLDKNHRGSRHMDLACYRVDGTVDHCEVRTSKPTRSLPHLIRLFEENMGGLRAQFGFETFVLSVLIVEELPAKQLNFSETNVAPADEEESFDALVDRLGMRFGFQKVNRIRVCESLLPEHAIEFQPAIAAPAADAEWPAYRVRPIRLLDPPMRIEVSILIPGGVPVQFLIGRQAHPVVRYEGPERLSAEWWRTDDKTLRARDYYRVEDAAGLRFWIFCDPNGHWFLHGHFA
jgi:protein ImuB